MANIVITVDAGHINLTGVGFMNYANHYYKAAKRVGSAATGSGFDPVPYQLYCQALELRLKAYIWLQDPTITRPTIRNRYGHNLVKLWKDAKHNGLHRFADITALRDRVVALVAPYYRIRQFCYSDLDMLFKGYKNLKSEPRVIPTLARLVARLGSSLHEQVLSASTR